jgi:hypothetical protein
MWYSCNVQALSEAQVQSLEQHVVRSRGLPMSHVKRLQLHVFKGLYADGGPKLGRVGLECRSRM